MELAPDERDYNRALGDIAMRLERYDVARAAYERVLAVDPGDEHAAQRLEQIQPIR